MTRAIVQDHSYETTEKLSHLKPNVIIILIKTLHAPGGEHANETRDPGITIPHSAHHSLILACSILFHCVHCNFCPSLILINKMNVHYMDLLWAQESDHNNNLSYKNRPKWDAADLKLSLTNTKEYLKSLQGTNKAPCSYMLRPHIVPLSTRIKRLDSGATPKRWWSSGVEQHGIYFAGTNAELLKDMHDLNSPKYVVILPCAINLKLIVEKTPTETWSTSSARPMISVLPSRNFRSCFLDQASPRAKLDSLRRSCTLSSTRVL